MEDVVDCVPGGFTVCVVASGVEVVAEDEEGCAVVIAEAHCLRCLVYGLLSSQEIGGSL